MKNFRIIFFILSIICAGFTQTVAQDSPKPTKLQRAAGKKKEAQARASVKAEERGKKKHFDLQSKKVKKRMKRNRHRYDHVDSFDRRPNFIQRIFPRRHPSAY